MASVTSFTSAFRVLDKWYDAVGCRLCVASGDADAVAKVKGLVPRWQERLALSRPCEGCHPVEEVRADLAFIRDLMPIDIAENFDNFRVEALQTKTVNMRELIYSALLATNENDSELTLIRRMCSLTLSREALIDCMSGAFRIVVARFGGLPLPIQRNIWHWAEDTLKVAIVAELHRIATRKSGRSFDDRNLVAQLGGAFVDDETFFLTLIRLIRAWSPAQRNTILEGAPTILHSTVFAVTLFDGGHVNPNCVLHDSTHLSTFSKVAAYCFSSMSPSWRETNQVFARFSDAAQISIALRMASGPPSTLCLCRRINHRLPDTLATALMSMVVHGSDILERLKSSLPLERLCSECLPCFIEVHVNVFLEAQVQRWIKDQADQKPPSPIGAERDVILARGSAWKDAYYDALAQKMSFATPSMIKELYEIFDDTDREGLRAVASRANKSSMKSVSH